MEALAVILLCYYDIIKNGVLDSEWVLDNSNMESGWMIFNQRTVKTIECMNVNAAGSLLKVRLEVVKFHSHFE